MIHVEIAIILTPHTQWKELGNLERQERIAQGSHQHDTDQFRR